MNKDDRIYIEHIRESISRILEYTNDLNEPKFLENKLVQDAVIRQFEVIGEATKNISDQFREKHNFVPWKKMTGMRDKLIHDYIGVDLWQVWKTIENDIPILKEKLDELSSSK